MNNVESQVKNKGWGNLLKGGVQVATGDSEADLQPQAGRTPHWAFHQVCAWKTQCVRVGYREIDFHLAIGHVGREEWWIDKWIEDVSVIRFNSVIVTAL